MILHKTEQLLNAASVRELPEGVIKGLFIRYSGTSQAGKTMTLGNLGTVRVNYKGTDIVNTDVTFFSAFNNLAFGVAEFAAAAGGAFSASIYVPFSAPWDDQNGIFVKKGDLGVVDLRFPAATIVEIVSGLVEVYYISAMGVAQYIPLYINQNIQAGGAGQIVDKFQQFNVSSLYVTENAIITGQVNVYRDGRTLIQSVQAVLKAYSNMRNRVETAITLYEIDLNPLRRISNALSSNVDINVTVNGAGTIVVTYLAFLFDAASRDASAKYIGDETAAQNNIPKALNASVPATMPLVNTR